MFKLLKFNINFSNTTITISKKALFAKIKKNKINACNFIRFRNN